MQTTFPTQPPKKQSFIEKTRNQIPAFIIFVNAAGKIQDDEF
ncbi:MAG: hypothetical protein ABFD07_18500 [Methanobacterium sp.]